MSDLLMSISVKDADIDPLGVKETIAMALEHLGMVRVLRVEVQEPEQLGLNGMAPARPAASPMPPPGGQAPAAGASAQPGRRASRPIGWAACENCVNYQKEYSRDERGTPYWGRCRETGRLVYELKGQCRAWEGAKRYGAGKSGPASGWGVL